MRVSNILGALALSTTTQAVDIRLYNARDCLWNYVACVGINPNTCCGRPQSSVSIFFAAIPKNWNLELRGYRGGSCANRVRTGTSGGQTSRCFAGPMTGGGYGFITRKREEHDERASEKCQVPNVLGFGNGTEISLEGMSEDEIDFLVQESL